MRWLKDAHTANGWRKMSEYSGFEGFDWSNGVGKYREIGTSQVHSKVRLPGETALLGVGNCGNEMIKEKLLKLSR